MEASSLKRSAFLRKPPDADRLTVKLKKCRCCKTQFVPRSGLQIVCGIECAQVVAKSKREKEEAARAKVERKADRQRKLELEPKQDKLKRLERVVNKIAVVRDIEDGCISCDKPAHWDGTWHGSHYKSVGSNSALRYNLLNIHKACSDCNWHRGGNIANYVPRLRQKIGQERLDWLDNHPRSREYDPDWLDRAHTVASKYLKRLKKRKGIT